MVIRYPFVVPWDEYIIPDELLATRGRASKPDEARTRGTAGDARQVKSGRAAAPLRRFLIRRSQTDVPRSRSSAREGRPIEGSDEGFVRQKAEGPPFPGLDDTGIGRRLILLHEFSDDAFTRLPVP